MSDDPFHCVSIGSDHMTLTEDFRTMGADKKQHVAVWFVVTLASSLLFAGAGLGCPVLLGVGVGVGLGVAKEIYDKYKRKATGFSVPDLMADAVGISAGAASALGALGVIAAL